MHIDFYFFVRMDRFCYALPLMVNYQAAAVSEVIQWTAVVFNLGFLYFMIREKTVAWPLGIIGSALMIYLFINSRIYLEAIVYLFYVGMGFFGWYRWSSGPEHVEESESSGIAAPTGITTWTAQRHALWILIGAAGTLVLGYVFRKYTDARLSFLDAFSTMFQFIATYLEARKVLSAWIYWIVLNVFATWFYARAGLKILSLQMVVFSVFSVIGYVAWYRRYNRQASGENK